MSYHLYYLWKVNFVPYVMTPSGTLTKTISLADHRPAHDIENTKCGCLALIYKDEKDNNIKRF